MPTMHTTHVFSRRTFLLVGIAAMVLTFASGQVIRPYSIQCHSWGSGLCAPVAGFPFAFVQNHPDGGSPIQDMGRIDGMDYWAPDIVGMVANIFVYGVLLWAGWWTLWRLRYDSMYARWHVLIVTTLVCAGVFCLATGGFGYRPVLAMN